MQWLFDASAYVPRNECGDWPGWMVAMSLIANTMIFIAYTAIPFWMYRFWSKKKHVLPYAWLIWGYIAFVLACGLTHLADVIVFLWPAYRLFLLADILTGIVSIGTLIMLPTAVRHLTRIIPPAEAHTLSRRMAATIADLESKKQG